MYIAKKPGCKFAGRVFKINEPIPDGYVLKEAAPRLICMGVIAEADDAGSLLPATASIEIPAEKPVTEESKPETTVEDLLKLKRGELAELAESYGIEVAEEDTKRVIAEAVIAKASEKEGSEE